MDQVSSAHRDRGVGSTEGGQAVVPHELRARVVIWPLLRLARVRCERGSVSVVWPTGSRGYLTEQEREMRIIALDVHRSFAQMAILENGVIRDAGKVDLERSRLWPPGNNDHRRGARVPPMRCDDPKLRGRVATSRPALRSGVTRARPI